MSTRVFSSMIAKAIFLPMSTRIFLVDINLAIFWSMWLGFLVDIDHGFFLLTSARFILVDIGQKILPTNIVPKKSSHVSKKIAPTDYQ